MEQGGGAHLRENIQPVVTGGAVRPQSHRDFRLQKLGYGGDPAGQLHIAGRVVGDGHLLPGQVRDLPVVQPDGMGRQNRAAKKPLLGQVGDGPFPVFLPDLHQFVSGFRQVDMDPQVVLFGRGHHLLEEGRRAGIGGMRPQHHCDPVPGPSPPFPGLDNRFFQVPLRLFVQADEAAGKNRTDPGLFHRPRLFFKEEVHIRKGGGSGE